MCKINFYLRSFVEIKINDLCNGLSLIYMLHRWLPGDVCFFVKSWCSIYGLSYVSFQSDDEDLDDDSDDDMSEDEETPKKVLMSNWVL